MEAEYAAAYPELYARHWWWRVREDILVSNISTLLSKPVDERRILDVGCGAGLFFDVLQQFGHVEGIESDPESVRRSGRWRSRITKGELDETFRPDKPFDLVLLLDVLEHVPHPDQLVRRAADTLRPGGHVLVTVPAFRWLWTNHDDLNHHLRRYTAGQLRGLLTEAGLENVSTSYVFQSLVVPKLAVTLIERIRSRPPRVPHIPPPGLNSALQAWYRAEYSLFGWLPFGGSILGTGQRRTAMGSD